MNDKQPLIIEAQPLLESMLADMERQDSIYQPGPYWQDYSRRIASEIDKHGLASFRSTQGIALGYADVFNNFSFDTMAPGWKKNMLIRMDLFAATRPFVDKLRSRVANRNRTAHHRKNDRFRNALDGWLQNFSKEHDLPPTTVGNPQRILSFSSGEIGELYLRNFAWIDEYSHHVDFENLSTVFEIGGGFGSMAHTLLHLFPNIKNYLYLDIPPNLYIGTQYLKSFFPESVVDYAETRDSDVIRFSEGNEREILAIAPWQIERVDTSIDFFWNSSSFQEMPRDTVQNYAGHIRRFLHPGTKVAMFVYETRDTVRTLPAKEIVDTMVSATELKFDALDTSIIDHILPGVCFLGVS